MGIGRQAAADRGAIDAVRLLREGPLLVAAALPRLQELVQPRPLHAGLDLDRAALGVEVEHLVELAGVDQHAVGAELLRPHRMAAAGDADRALLAPREKERAAHGIQGIGLDDLENERRAELRVDVVDQKALGLVALAFLVGLLVGFGLGLGLGVGLRPGGSRPRRRQAGGAEEFTAADHAPPLVRVGDSEAYSVFATWRTMSVP